LLKKVPDDTGLAVALALIHRKKGNFDEAVRLLGQACATQPDALCSVTLAALELDRNRADAAGRILDELIDRLQRANTRCPGCGRELDDPDTGCAACGERPQNDTRTPRPA
jgi:predicted Zn-dependent protease